MSSNTEMKTTPVKKIRPYTMNTSGVPMLLDSFTSPVKNQSGSPLLRLAAELRLKILRNLLRADTVIKSERHFRQSNYGDNEGFVEQNMLSSQMLACCQQLYAEGRHILYQKNKLSLTLEPHYFDVLNIAARLSNKSMQLNSKDEDILFITKRHRHLRPLFSRYAVISEFGCLCCEFKSFAHQDFYIQCRLFRNLFEGKRIEATILHEEIGTFEGPSTFKPWLNAFRVFRCKEIQFINLRSARTERLRQIIMGDSKLIDQFDILRGFKEFIRVSRINQFPAEDSAREAGRRLIGVCMNYAAVEMVDSNPGLSSEVDELITDVLAPRRDVLKLKMQELIAEQKRLNACETAMRATIKSVQE